MTYQNETNLLWLDLEMTGLEVDHDVILEVAWIITDKDLTIISEEYSSVIHHENEVLARMNTEVRTMHTRSGLIERVRESKTNVKDVEQKIMDVLQKSCIKNKTILCGNSIWQDRYFLMKYMPKIIEFLHYRMIDVSSFKEAIYRWYPDSPHNNFRKEKEHRALDDIHESIKELKHYRKYFLK